MTIIAHVKFSISNYFKNMSDLNKHFQPKNFSDKVALSFTKFLRLLADTFFKKRYGHRAVVLETVAAVPGMVAGMLLHLKSLRKIEDDKGWIKTLLDEAENERMHLMTFVHIAKPTAIERFIIMIAQFIFILTYAIIYLVSQRTAHRIVGYFEEEAVISYTEYLNELEAGTIPDQPAPEIAINYWNLPLHSTLKDVVRVIRDDEAGHRDVNHQFADLINLKKSKNLFEKKEKLLGFSYLLFLALPYRVLSSATKKIINPNLSKAQKNIMFNEGTERAFTSDLLKEDREGFYHCANCNAKLFASNSKFDSGTGWPSFSEALPGAFKTKIDYSFGMKRVEYHCANCGAHHGHVFLDGPTATGKRFCNNGLCLIFIPEN